ncbi:hypothetical protein MLD38_022096 [Melastoma candidum]|uniref:Uncharacterized protein n=1 Tax=Melastoma candidum TaxID=119954 RepID=A0ACB9QIM7_9MYRT|nr:hypothetical protein MLD38_022096 [Melastoma candidum]
MGTENPGRPSFPGRPASTPFSSSQVPTVFSSPGPMGGPAPSAFRPATPPAPNTNPYPATGPVATRLGLQNSRPPSQYTSNGPSFSVPPQSYVTPTYGTVQRPNAPQYPMVPQAFTSGPPPSQPSTSQLYSQPGSSRPLAQVSNMPMGSPPLRGNIVTPGPSMPSGPPFNLGSSAYPGSQPNVPPTLPGFSNQQPPTVPQASLGPASQTFQPPFASAQGGYPAAPPAASPPFGNQGYTTPPPPPLVGVQPGIQQRPQGAYPISGPPLGSLTGLVEDFNSLSLGSVPGSVDAGIDSRSLPRPLDGDVESTLLAEMFPLNCKSNFLRLTTGAIPNSQSLVQRWHLPLGAVVCPLAECPNGEAVPVVNFSSVGIIRCRKCRTYVNPYVTFTDAGRKWRCNICSLPNDVPGEYFAHLDASGKRFDLDQRPELTKGSIEFVAPTEYMVRPPMPPLYFFLIDVSITAARSGMIEVVAQTIKSCLDDLPGSPRTQIGFITFDSNIHFYNMKSSLNQPQMMVVSDLDDIFVPLPDDLLVNLSESRSIVETFLDSLPSMFLDNVNLESAFGPALKAAYMVMSQLGGKLLIFQSALPSLGVGRLKLRGDDTRIYGTDKEHALRIPEDPFYKQMAADLTKFQIAVNVYAFSDKYTDIASLGTLAKYTGGQVYYYPSFQSATQGEKLRHELSRDLTRETAWEAVMRVRCGKGIRFTSYHGNFMLRSTDLLALPAIDCDKAYAMQLSLEETLLTTQTVYFQVALLYTASCGERRIRVHTAAAPVVADLSEMYRYADTGAIVSLFSRLAIEKSLTHKLEDARSSIQQRIVKALREYRSLYAVQHRLAGRMIYPESLKLLPLYGLALTKSAALRGGYADASLDERCAAGYTIMALPVQKLLKLLYPNLIRLDEHVMKGSVLTKKLPLTAESLDSRGLYLYDDGLRFILWFGRMLSPDIAMSLLGPDCAADLSRVNFHERDEEMSRKIFALLKKSRENDPSYYQLCNLVRQGEQPREGLLLLANLVEDQIAGTNGYVDWIVQIHRQVQQNA